jgi:hypothetical protein
MSLRNKVIHGNARVTAAHARNAVTIAQAMVDHYTPLKVP